MKPVLRAVVVDDEPIARRVLREELEVFEDVDVVAEAATGQEALAVVDALAPDLLFLDLQMPGMGGFDVVRRLKGGRLPFIIFVTAFDQHAIEAFEAGAIDYLLKPVAGPRLAQAVERARQFAGKPENIAESVARLQNAVPPARGGRAHRKIVGKAGEEFFLLGADEVLAFQADGDLVWIVTAKQRYLATQTLRSLQEKLDSNFQRVHRSALVNVNHVRKMSALTSHRWLLTLTNGQEFIVSKRQAKVVRELLAP